MRAAVSLLLFFATITSGQTVGEHQVLYGPFEPGPGGRATAMAIAPPQGFKAARVTSGESVRTFTLADPRALETTPVLAGSLAVFARDGDVFGIPIQRDSFGQVFPISTGEPWDSEPRVYATGQDTYFVVYVREGDGNTASLAARIVESRP